MRTRTLALSLFVFTLTLPCAAQAPDQFVGGGAFFCQDCTPQINGTFAFVKKLAGETHPTYTYSAVNVVNIQQDAVTRHFSVLTTSETGVVQHVTRLGPFDVLAGVAPGVSTAGNPDGTNVGFSIAAPVVALADFGKGWRGGPCFRAAKSTVDSGQWSIGFILGWGK